MNEVHLPLAILRMALKPSARVTLTELSPKNDWMQLSIEQEGDKFIRFVSKNSRPDDQHLTCSPFIPKPMNVVEAQKILAASQPINDKASSIKPFYNEHGVIVITQHTNDVKRADGSTEVEINVYWARPGDQKVVKQKANHASQYPIYRNMDFTLYLNFGEVMINRSPAIPYLGQI